MKKVAGSTKLLKRATVKFSALIKKKIVEKGKCIGRGQELLQEKVENSRS